MKQRYPKGLSALLLAGAALLPCATATAGLTPPNEFTFNTLDEFNEWTVIDNNAATCANTWEFSETDKAALYTQSTTKPADEWLISPGIQLEVGKAYTITVSIRNATTYPNDKQKFSIQCGSEPTIAGLSTQIFKKEDLSRNSEYTEFSGIYSPTSDGENYLAIHLYSASFMGNCLVNSVKIEEKVPHPGAVTGLTATPAPKGALGATLNWTWPSIDDCGNPLTKLSGGNVYRGKATNNLTQIGVVSGGNPGEPGTFTDNTIEAQGYYYYKVIPFDENGESPVFLNAVKTDFIGPGTSTNISNVVATLVDEDLKQIDLTWDGPEQTSGYIDPERVTYKITRYGALSKVTVTLEEDWNGTLPYHDTVDAIDSYSYTVYIKLDGTTQNSFGSISNSVTVAGVLDLPYYETFDNSSALAFYTLFHEGDCTKDWHWNASAIRYYSSPADAWACTPKFNMEAGKAYKISFSSKISNTKSPKNLSVYFGTAATAEALQDNEIFAETIASTTYATKEAVFSVPADGEYYVAFRCSGPSDGNDLFVDNVKIEEIITVPLTVTDLKAEAAEGGEMAVTLSWVNPVKTNAGSDIAELTKAVVKRGNDIVKEITELTPGTPSTYVDTPTAPGKYTYSVSVFMDDKESASESVTTGWVGADTPKAPATVTATLKEDGSREITFAEVTEGINDGYVGEVTYNVYRGADLLAEGIEETTYTDDESDMPLAKYVYSVSAVFNEAESAKTASNGVVFGGAISLPYVADFSDADAIALWAFNNEAGDVTSNKNWEHQPQYKCIKASFSAKDAWAFMPPMIMYPGTLSVTIKATPYGYRYPETLDIMLCENNDAKDPQMVQLIETHTAASVYPTSTKYEFTIPEPAGAQMRETAKNGKQYYIAFKRTTEDYWTLELNQADVEQHIITGVNNLTAESLMQNGIITLPEGASIELFAADGVKVAKSASDFNTANLQKGVYVAVVTFADGNRTSLKFSK